MLIKIILKETHTNKWQSLDNSKMVLGNVIDSGALVKQLGSGLDRFGQW